VRAGQVLREWWQKYVGGELRSPSAIVQAARAENPDFARASDRFFGVPDDDGKGFDTPTRLVAPSIFWAAGYLDNAMRADWAQVDPRLMRWAALFQEYARKRGVPLYVHSALRDEATQNALAASGRSKAVYPLSPHNIGEAVDIVHGVFHWDLTPAEWKWLHVIGRLALDRVNSTLKRDDKLQLVWGGTFETLYDPAHWEIKDFRQRRRKLAPSTPVHMMPRAILNMLRA
jgi:hypothetical protein